MLQQFWEITGIADITGLAQVSWHFDRTPSVNFASKVANGEGRSPAGARMAVGL